MLAHAHVVSHAKTHISRGCAARMTELKGLDEDQIRRLGHWASGAMERHYLSALPRKGMRVMSGFSPRENSYFIKRDCLEPPESLLQQIFPQLDNTLLLQQQGQADQSLSCIGFLKLLKKLREVVLQDSVFLQDCYPELFLWRHSLFRSTEYQNFKSELLNAVDVEEDPSITRMEDVMPDMCAAVRHQTNTITMDMSIHGTRLSRIENQLNRIETQLNREITQLNRDRTQLNRIVSGMHAFSSISIGSQLNQAGSQFEGPDDFESVDSENGDVIEPNRVIIAQTAPRQKFKMIRNEKMTVKELWEEWTIGYPLRVPPIPSIRSLETQGTYWREGSESRYFNRRKLILDQVQFRIDNGMSNDAAIIAVEAMKGALSLNSLSNSITRAINNRFPNMKRPKNVGIIVLD